jgi:hypothetical protein
MQLANDITSWRESGDADTKIKRNKKKKGFER